ncbi:hypothetical protein M8C21_015650 [Ambrosia artemisiifolia]|uniref:Uncharacterized protein n=1 Tax=Ambrosia artemisiifolia TaxID=4212 RepID=A0AAD5BYV4_AMBAR|nr:hypothetical protein M8C21_015650 [Ambrosia artemisiifolia]
MKLQHKYPVQVGYMAASFAQDIVEKSWNYKILKVLFTSVAMSRFSTYEIGARCTIVCYRRSFIQVQEDAQEIIVGMVAPAITISASMAASHPS